jgi:hypothetical protein
MMKRPLAGRGLFYTRDSEGRSELAPPQYVDWAQREAAKLGVQFDGTPDVMSAMIKGDLSWQGDLYLDYGISGNILSRPGFDAFVRRSHTDLNVSHLFVPRRDRIARPDNPFDAMTIENELRRDGLTVVLMDAILPPLMPGERAGMGEAIMGLLAYDNAGQFRRELASKLIHAKVRLAQGGFSIGGEPLYGFRRWLVAPDGTRRRELEVGEIVKMTGHHVVWWPSADDELEVVRRIIEQIEMTPASRIARMLNDEGIPSPKAGRIRKIRGVEVPNSGLWTQTTVKNLATHPLLIAMWEYGRRASGDQLRMTPTGPRPLTSSDRTEKGRPKAINVAPEATIHTPAKFEAIITTEYRDRVVKILDERGKHLKGKPRTRGDRPNPLGGRIYDLNCGWPLFRHERRGRWNYQCGLYQNSQAKVCSHNLVPGEMATRFVLNSLRQRILKPTAMAKLKARLLELAKAEAGDDSASRTRKADESRLAALGRQLETVARNMALAESPERREATAKVFDEIRVQSDSLKTKLAREVQPSDGVRPEQEVEMALAGLDRLTDLAASPQDHAAIGELFRSVDVRLYLRFASVKQRVREVQKVAGGVLTFGSTPPPMPLYEGPTDRAILQKRLRNSEPVSSTGLEYTEISQGADREDKWSANVQRGTSRCSGARTAAAFRATIQHLLGGAGPRSLGVRPHF